MTWIGGPGLASCSPGLASCSRSGYCKHGCNVLASCLHDASPGFLVFASCLHRVCMHMQARCKPEEPPLSRYRSGSSKVENTVADLYQSVPDCTGAVPDCTDSVPKKRRSVPDLGTESPRSEGGTPSSVLNRYRTVGIVGGVLRACHLLVLSVAQTTF